VTAYWSSPAIRSRHRRPEVVTGGESRQRGRFIQVNSGTLAAARLAEQPLKVVPADFAVGAGDELSLDLRPDRLRLCDPADGRAVDASPVNASDRPRDS
jgi:hypothetical protein